MTDNADSDGSGTTASTTTTENSPLCPQKKTSSYGGASLKSSPANSPSIGRGTRISSTGNLRRPSRRRGSGGADDDGSVFSSFTSTSKPIISRQSFVLAPDDVDLPPQTPLYGSSKMAANASLVELRSVNSTAEIRRKLSVDEEAVFMDDEDTNNGDEFLLLETMSSNIDGAHTLKDIKRELLMKSAKTQKSFYQDTVDFAEGSIPQSIIIATCIGCVCGVVAYLYYSVLDFLLDVIWKDLPEKYVIDKWPEHLYVLWIPLMSVSLSICCGLSIYYLGEPGDLAYTIQCVHEKGYKGTHHIIPMVCASLFTILAGGSLGPEAPLVAICAATAGFLSRKVFKQKSKNIVRKHTFMGMAGALSAFFGVPLGGSLFALEVASRFGIEYFEHLIESIFAGEICVVVFRSLAGLPLEQIWANVDTPSVGQADPYMIVLGGIIGLLGAGLAFLWANFHWRLMAIFGKLGLLDDDNIYAVPRVLLGALGVVTIGMFLPQTLFWGEWEFPVLATLSPASDLPHVWPTSGLLGFEMDSGLNCVIVGFCKLIAISFTVAGGYRGGFIFPFFTAGAAFGRGLCFVFPTLSPIIATLCFAAGINVAITRTALATSLILAFLAGEQLALPVILAASVASLFATSYMPFIKSQIARSDIDSSLFIDKNQ